MVPAIVAKIVVLAALSLMITLKVSVPSVRLSAIALILTLLL